MLPDVATSVGRKYEPEEGTFDRRKRIVIQPICRLVKETNVPGDVICEYQSQKKVTKIKKFIWEPQVTLVKKKLLAQKSNDQKKNFVSFRERVWTLLEPAAEDDKASRITDIFLVTLIFFNILMVILETVESLYINYKTFFKYFEYFSVTVFSIEYFGRLWSCIENKRENQTNGQARIKYISLAFLLL